MVRLIPGDGSSLVGASVNSCATKVDAVHFDINRTRNLWLQTRLEMEWESLGIYPWPNLH